MKDESNLEPLIDTIKLIVGEDSKTESAIRQEMERHKHRGSCRVFYTEDVCTCGLRSDSESGEDD